MDTGTSWDINTNFSSDLIGDAERPIIQESTDPSPIQNSIGYEELLPRLKPDIHSGDEFSNSSWDDDTLSSNFCSDNESKDVK